MICGSPIGRSTPLPIPKSTGLSDAAGYVLPSCAVCPNRASFSSPDPKVCVSFTVSALFQMLRRWPNPGMLVPCAVGSIARHLLPAEEHHACDRGRRPCAGHRPSSVFSSTDCGSGADEPRRAVGVEIVRAAGSAEAAAEQRDR